MESTRRKKTRTNNKRKKNNKRLWIACFIGLFILIIIMVLAFVLVNNEKVSKKKPEVKDATKKMQEATKNRIQDRLLKNNKYSRPGIELQKVKDVVVHYTGNPGTNAIANRNYFNNLPRTNRLQQKEVYASSHYIIGLDGKIIRCIPENEISYASNSRNYDTLSIECCHPDSSGEFTKATYDSLVWLVSQICKYYELDKDEIIRHYDVNGKICPKFFVDNPASWELFRQDVINYGKAY